MTLPMLYKKTSTGAIQFWTIYVYEDSDHSTAYIMETQYGQLGTDSPQTTLDTIWTGKNVGKKNETSAQKQAELEAKAKWEKQKKKGYVESMDAALAGEVDELIEGGILPMLAHKFVDQGHKIKYPAFVQPKLDGIRCIAIVEKGKCTLWSRTRKPITGMPHIVEELQRIFAQDNVVLDGELYNHDYKSNFERIVSLVRQENADPDHKLVQYHVYDVINDSTFQDRSAWLQIMFRHFAFDYTKRVPTYTVNYEDEVMDYFDDFRAQGYEGAMLRNSLSKYVNKRSYDLQKVKEFDDGEFKIVGITEGRGKLAGHAIFVCMDDKGDKFEAKMKGDTARLKEYFENHALWEGKKLTVKYQGLTSAKKVPRFPIAHAIRDYE